MSALSRYVSHTFADISHKRQSKRLVHEADIPVTKTKSDSMFDDNPNFNTFDPAEHFGASIWEPTSSRPDMAVTTSSTSPSITPSHSPSSSVSEKSSSPVPTKATQLKNMVRKLTPSFNNNTKEMKNKNVPLEEEKDKQEGDDEKKNEKKGVWKIKDTIQKRTTKRGEHQMLIEVDSESF